MSLKKLHPSVIAASVIVGALLSGYAAGKGVIFAGHDPTAGWPFPDLTGLVIFVLGALVCPILAIYLVTPLSHHPPFPRASNFPIENADSTSFSSPDLILLASFHP